MRHYYTTSQLSEHMEFTPEGYLLCIGVPIARTGALEYLPEEVPEELAETASGPTVLVYRNPEDVFSEATIASYEGKDVTVDHPDDFVTPQTWRELTVGHAQNVRPGEGKDADLLLADLLIKDQDAIDLILPPQPEDGGTPEEPLREVSCGYDADYELVASGIGKQSNIIGNHIALVPHGRCGTRCAIRDKEPLMATTTKTTRKKGFWDRIMGNPKVKKAMDEAAAEEKTADEEQEEAVKPPDSETEQQTATDSPDIAEKLDEMMLMLRSLVDALKPKDCDTTTDDDGETGDDDPEQTGDDEPEQTGDEDTEQTGDEDSGASAKTGDSRARVADAVTVARAGRLAPNMRFMTGDSATAVKRAALRSAMRNDDAVARMVNTCLGRTPLQKAKGYALDAAFAAASELVTSRNNARTGKALAGAKARDAKASGPTTAADINKINREFRDSQKK